MIEVNEIYTPAQLRKELNISEYIWKNKKEELFDYISKFFDIEFLPSGRHGVYLIKEIYADYIPMPKNADRIKQFYSERTIKEIEKSHYNTGSNVAREILYKENRYSHQETTAARYVREILKEEYIPREERKWCKLDPTTGIYEPMPKEELIYLAQLFAELEFNKGMRFADLVADNDNDPVKIGNAVLQTYNQLMNQFQNVYGYRPMKVKYYERKY